MTDTTQPGAAAPEPTPIAVHKAAGEGALSMRDAANSLIDWRRKGAAETTEQKPEPEGAETATPEPAQESAPEAGAAPPQEATGETQESDPAELPPLDLPRSWTKEQAEHWKALPRATQEYLTERASQDSAEVRRSQNEAAEQRKAIEADRSKVEQARQQYETALPILLQNLQANLSGEFADITTMTAVQKMAAEDWPRYIRWDAQQKQVAAVQQEIGAAQTRQSEEKRTKLSEFMRRESELFAEHAPELADETQAAKLRSAAVNVLKSLDFKDQELGELWNGQKEISVHDHRFQLILRDAVKWQEAQQKAKAIPQKAKPVPPVQRPGAAQPKGAAQEARVQELTKQLSTATGNKALRIATELRIAQSGR